MNKHSSIFITITIIFQLLTAAFHSLSFIMPPVATNATEEQMLRLMNTYKMDMGNGIFRTYSQIIIALSVNLTLICLLAALLNWFLKRKKVGPELWQGVLLIQSIIFGALFIVVLLF